MSKEITLTQGKVAIVDDEDYEKVNSYKWCYDKPYARRTTWDRALQKQSVVRMHRFIMGVPKGKFIDHINGDGLDNRKINLRICTQAQNNSNRKKDIRDKHSKYKGARLRNNRWYSYITISGNMTYIGAFDSELEAAKAYDAAALLHFGEFANLNFKGGKDAEKETTTVDGT
jgi:hypothetical protein